MYQFQGILFVALWLGLHVSRCLGGVASLQLSVEVLEPFLVRDSHTGSFFLVGLDVDLALII